MNAKHKHYEFIVAFAEGKCVEYLPHPSLNFRHENTHWKPVVSAAMFEQDGIVFRLKPEQKKDRTCPATQGVVTVGYRRFIWKDEDGAYWVGTWDDDGISCQKDIERLTDFVRWIDPDWRYEIVEE